MSDRQWKANSVSRHGSLDLRRRKERATQGVHWAISQIERREALGAQMTIQEELGLMACAFVMGARGSRDGKIPLSMAERAKNEILDTASVGHQGVRLWVQLTDGVLGSGGNGGWYVGYEDESLEDEAPKVEVAL